MSKKETIENTMVEQFDRTMIPNDGCMMYRALRRTICNEVVRQYPSVNRWESKVITDKIIEKYFAN